MEPDAAVCERARPREAVHMSSAALRPLQTSSATRHELRSCQVDVPTELFRYSAAGASKR